MSDLWGDVKSGNFTPMKSPAALAAEQATAPQPKIAEEEQQKVIDTSVGKGLLAASGHYVQGSEKIYVDIRALLDARIGTLATLGEEHAVRALNNGYFNRLIDDFEGVDKEAYKKLYWSDNMLVLKHGVITNVKYLLRRFVKDALMHTIQNRTHEPLVFEINTYPYKFTEEEIRMLIMCVRFVTYSTSAVRIVSLSNDDLTPDFCNANYEVMVRYDWMDWLEKHKKFYETSRTPNMVIIAPELWRDVAPTAQDVIDNEMDRRNPFRETEKLFASLFRLKLYPVSLFCMLEAINKNNVGKIIERVGITEQDIEAYIEKNHSGKKVTQENPLPEVPLNLSSEPSGEDFDLL